MRIAFPFNADQIGGSSVSAFALIETLLKENVDVSVVLHGDGKLVGDAARLGVPTLRLPQLPGRPTAARQDGFHFGNLSAVADIWRAIRRNGFDIVHVNDLSMLRTWAPVVALSGAKLIMHWRSNYKRSYSVNLGLRQSSRIISIAKYNYARLPKWAQKKSTIEYNAHGEIFSLKHRIEKRRDIRKHLNITEEAQVIGVFGTLTVRKRAHVLADVLHALSCGGRPTGPIYGLACGKRGKPFDSLLGEKITQYGLEKRLLLPGFVSPSKDWMAACDLILAPAEQEPFGRSVFEAAEVGVPLIMSSDSGAAEIIEDRVTGLLCDPLDLQAWIAAVADLLDSPEPARAIVAAARERLVDFEPLSHAKRITKIYEKELPPPSRGRAHTQSGETIRPNISS